MSSWMLCSWEIMMILLTPRLAQPVDLGLHRWLDRFCDDVPRAGDGGQQLGRPTDDAKLLTALVDDGATYDAVTSHQPVEGWLPREVEIRAHQWGPESKLCTKLAKMSGPKSNW